MISICCCFLLCLSFYLCPCVETVFNHGIILCTAHVLGLQLSSKYIAHQKEIHEYMLACISLLEVRSRNSAWHKMRIAITLREVIKMTIIEERGDREDKSEARYWSNRRKHCRKTKFHGRTRVENWRVCGYLYIIYI